jgi:hypothetical protein
MRQLASIHQLGDTQGHVIGVNIFYNKGGFSGSADIDNAVVLNWLNKTDEADLYVPPGSEPRQIIISNKTYRSLDGPCHINFTSTA